jgi:hypothetical protein
MGQLSVLGEFEGVDLGDARLNARLALLGEALSRDPEQSFPDAMKNAAELEGAYRFLNNPRVAPDAVIRPHVLATAARMAKARRVLALHDTTEFAFGGRHQREGLEGDRFRAHVCLAVSADGRREPLGVLAIDPWVRTEKKGRRTTAERLLDDTRESKRWLKQSLAVEAVAEECTLIHVEDREADIYESMQVRLERGMHFIVRAQKYRVVELDDDKANILEFMREQPRRFERSVSLSQRRITGGKRSHKDRDPREARLAFAAAPVNLRRPKLEKNATRSLALNAVHVVELDAPDGEEPVEWLLLTTEPIATDAELEFVVDSYRARWVIEEYFKALKTGCAYESRQLESYDALKRALAIFSVIAWRLLWVRFLARNAPTSPATVVASNAEIGVLVAQKRIAKGASIGDFLDAIARLGGHIKHNGPPGWQVLWRGYRKLIDLAAGYRAGLLAKRSDQ